MNAQFRRQFRNLTTASKKQNHASTILLSSSFMASGASKNAEIKFLFEENGQLLAQEEREAECRKVELRNCESCSKNDTLLAM